jgi:Zn-dependent peptidase ImmA (M78 family)/DNA-binding XRE family transcriptional regulator
MRRLLEFRGEMVRLARQARGMTQKELAGEVGITQAYVSMIEDGERNPTNSQEESIANALGFPIAFFYSQDPVLGPSIGEIFHRRKKHIPSKQLERFYAWANIETFSARKLLDAIEWPECTLVPLSLDIDVETEEDAAAFLRARWYVPTGPIRNVSSLLARAGILVLPAAYAVPEIDGMSYWVADMPPVISINVDTSQDRLRFTLMHEVGHMVLHHRSSPRAVSDSIELEANNFSSAFLMPASEIRPQLKGLTLTRLADLKRHWKVSMAALLMRARQLETISPREEKDLWKELARRGWKRREPAQLDVHGEDPVAMYRQLVRVHLRDLGYSEIQLANKLNISVADLKATKIEEAGALRLLS